MSSYDTYHITNLNHTESIWNIIISVDLIIPADCCITRNLGYQGYCWDPSPGIPGSPAAGCVSLSD